MNMTTENQRLWKDIKDIDDMLDQYYRFGLLDREKSIFKIMELRMKNENIGKVVAVELPSYNVPLGEMGNKQLADELNRYKAILTGTYLFNT